METRDGQLTRRLASFGAQGLEDARLLKSRRPASGKRRHERIRSKRCRRKRGAGRTGRGSGSRRKAPGAAGPIVTVILRSVVDRPAAFLSLVISELVAGKPQAGIITVLAAAAVGFIALAAIRQWLGLRAAFARDRPPGRQDQGPEHASGCHRQLISGGVPCVQRTCGSHSGRAGDALGPYLGNFYPQQFRLKIVPLASSPLRFA